MAEVKSWYYGCGIDLSRSDYLIFNFVLDKSDVLHLQVLHKTRIVRLMEMRKRRKISLQSPKALRRRKRKIKLPRM